MCGYDNNIAGQIIYERRRALGLTLQDIGNYVGVSKSTVKKWENGTILNMRSDKLCRLAEVLKINANELIGTDKAEKMLSGSVKIAVIGRVSAGIGCYAEENIEGWDYAQRELVKNGEYAFLRVQGDSMEPLINNGDLVLVKRGEYVENGVYAVVIIDNEDGVVKKVRYDKKKRMVELISINPEYPVRRFEGEETNRLRFFGTVVESRHKFA